MHERCELLAKTRQLAVKKGLDPRLVNCPYEEGCKGLVCDLVEDKLKDYQGILDKFYLKIR